MDYLGPQKLNGDFFWDGIVPHCTPPRTSGCFLSPRETVYSANTGDAAASQRHLKCPQPSSAGTGASHHKHIHLVTPDVTTAPFPCTAPNLPATAAFCSQVTFRSPVSQGEGINRTGSQWHRQWPNLYSRQLEGHNVYHAF